MVSIEFGCKNGTFRFCVESPQWCRVYWLNGQGASEVCLGADNPERIAQRISDSLSTEGSRRVWHYLGHEVFYMLHLGDIHTTWYVSRSDYCDVIFLENMHGNIIDQVEIADTQRVSWITVIRELLSTVTPSIG
jgi:hypothetical protein